MADDIPPAEAYGDITSELLVVGWGSTFGAIRSAVDKARSQGYSVSHLHLRYINPLPKNLGEVLLKYPRILVPELNMGQLVKIIRAEFLVDAIPLNKVQGRPFTTAEVLARMLSILAEVKNVG